VWPSASVSAGKIFTRTLSMKPPAGARNGNSMADRIPGKSKPRSRGIVAGGTLRINCAAIVASVSPLLRRSATCSGATLPS